ncbi:hypothetical protein MTR67_018789 [Solanum verrucosum]|uniref:Integrase catalytic domain-containing protein n=1 Tax=Solanum verrucosum TaxID=315347 RepID=A0AAF0TMZ6_SOLVR|nr:hypothetical protein MTR67_018789 [Solanum verrucosum]
MDFITGLFCTRRLFDSIWVIVDQRTKSAHFLLVKTSFSAEDYVRLYIREIVRLHRVPLSIISDCGTQFASQFWRLFQKDSEVSVEILDQEVRKLRSKEVASVKVFWKNQSVEGATWEAEADMMFKYPHLFPSAPIIA